MTNLNDYITENIKGKCFEHKTCGVDIVQLVEFVPANQSSDNRARIKVWYPLEDKEGYLDSSVFENYIQCSATEIERIRRLGKTPQTESNILSLDSAREARDKKGKAEQYDKIAHLADHVPQFDKPKK
jgi:hypothetical protein